MPLHYFWSGENSSALFPQQMSHPTTSFCSVDLAQAGPFNQTAFLTVSLILWAYNKDNVASAWRYDVKLAARLTFRNLMKMYMVSTQNSSTGICVWHKLLWFGNEYCSLVFKWCWHTLDSWMNAWHKTKKLYNKIPCLHTEQHMNVLLYALCFSEGCRWRKSLKG